MKRINHIIIVLFFIITLNSCLELSSSLFNPSAIETYLYEDYDSGDFNLDSSYDVLPNELTEFSVISDLDGEKATIFGAYLGDVDAILTDTVILYCHGNSGNMDDYYQRTKLLYNTNGKSNYGVLLFDYRGFGKSEGTTSEESLKADAFAMIEWLKDKGLTSDRLLVYGFSLGSIPAISACWENYPLTPSMLLLEAPIGSIDVMAEDASGLSISASYFADLQTNNIEDIKNCPQDLFWLHGIDDDFLNRVTHGLPIYDNHHGKYKVFYAVEEGNHGDTPFIMGFDKYIESVKNFIIRN